MHHRTAGKIETGHQPAGSVQQSALAPHHVGHWEIHQEAPQDREQEHRAELHPLGECARDQGRRDDSEHQLVDHEGLLGNGRGIVGIGCCAHVIQEGEVQISNDWRRTTERQAVADEGPQHRNDSHQDKAVHHGAEDVFATDQAAVEEGEPRAGHHEDQRGAGEHPGIVARTLGRLRSRFEGRDSRLEIRDGLAGQGPRCRKQRECTNTRCIFHGGAYRTKENLNYCPKRTCTCQRGSFYGRDSIFLWNCAGPHKIGYPGPILGV